MFKSFFKKKSNKENEQPVQSQEVLHRHYSVRGSTRRNDRSSKFEEQDDHLSPSSINPYHSVGKPRARGPRSCPGGYQDQGYYRYDDYDVDTGKSQRTRHEKFRRSGRDTSEYGSGDPSPIGHASRQVNYNTSLIDDSEEDEYDYQAKQWEVERRLHEKMKISETKRIYYKDQCRKLKQQKESNEEAFNERVQSMKAQLEKERKEKEVMRQEIKMLKQRIEQYEMQLYQNRTSMGGMFGPPPSFGGPASFAYPLSTPNRFPMPGPPQMTHIPMMTTPGTSTGMETSASGAGEALSQPGDLSFQPGSINFNSSYDSKQIDDEADERKSFDHNDGSFIGISSTDTYELKRGDVSSSSIGIQRHESVTLVRQVACDSKGSSSTVVVDDAQPEEEDSSELRRTASDGALN